jgi:hypothetical protein
MVQIVTSDKLALCGVHGNPASAAKRAKRLQLADFHGFAG